MGITLTAAQIAVETQFRDNWLVSPAPTAAPGADISVSATDNSFNSAASVFVAADYPAGTIILTSGFAEDENNGLKKVSSATASKIVVENDLETEAANEDGTINILRTPVAWENVSFAPPKGDLSWVDIALLVLRTEYPRIGATNGASAARRYFGAINVNVYTRPDIGAGTANALAVLAANVFAGQTFDGVHCTLEPPEITKVGVNDQKKYQINVSCPCWWEE